MKPLLAGEIRSSFAMTEPDVASSDATNVASLIVRDGDHYVINGRKWYTTGATDPRCKIIIFMGQTDPAHADRHKRQSMILVPKDTPGVDVVRSLPVLGFYGVPDRASEVIFTNVRVPAANMLLGEGRGSRDRARTAGTWAHPSLHAVDRPLRACPRAHVPASAEACRFRQAY